MREIVDQHRGDFMEALVDGNDYYNFEAHFIDNDKIDHISVCPEKTVHGQARPNIPLGGFTFGDCTKVVRSKDQCFVYVMVYPDWYVDFEHHVMQRSIESKKVGSTCHLEQRLEHYIEVWSKEGIPVEDMNVYLVIDLNSIDVSTSIKLFDILLEVLLEASEHPELTEPQQRFYTSVLPADYHLDKRRDWYR